MMNSNLIYLLGLCAVATGCTNTDVAKTDTPKNHPTTAVAGDISDKTDKISGYHHRPPMELLVDGPANPQLGDTVVVTVTVTRQWLKPFDLAVVLPPGVKLVSGQLKEHITDTTSTVITRKLTVVIDAMPSRSIEVTSDIVGDGFGVHAVRELHFGKTVPMMQQPKRAGKEIFVDGKSIGRPIEIGVNNQATQSP